MLEIREKCMSANWAGKFNCQDEMLPAHLTYMNFIMNLSAFEGGQAAIWHTASSKIITTKLLSNVISFHVVRRSDNYCFKIIRYICIHLLLYWPIILNRY